MNEEGPRSYVLRHGASLTTVNEKIADVVERHEEGADEVVWPIFE